MNYCDFKVGEKVVYLGRPTWRGISTIDEGMERFEECTVRRFIPGTGTTFLTLKGYHELYLWDYFCRPNDDRLRGRKLRRLAERNRYKQMIRESKKENKKVEPTEIELRKQKIKYLKRKIRENVKKANKMSVKPT